MSDLATVAALALLGGALSLDATAAFQVMVSQPLVAGSLAGLVVGDVRLGLAIGGALQLVWLGTLPVGAAPFPDAPPATVVGVGLAALLFRGGWGCGWSLAAGVLVALAVGALGQRVVLALRKLNVRFAALAESRAERGDPAGVTAAVALALGSRFVAGAVLVAVSLGSALALLSPPGPPGGATPFPTALWAAPVAAAAVAARGRGVLEWVLLSAGFAAGIAVIAAT